MKRIPYFVLVLLLFMTSAGFSQQNAIDRFFSDYQNNDDFTSVYVSPKMFQMMSQSESASKDEELMDIIRDIKGLKILTADKNTRKYYNESRKKIPVSEYEVLLDVRDAGNNVHFYTRESNGKITELLLLVGGDSEFVMMSFTGNLDLDKIGRLSKGLNVGGAQHLDKLNKK
jgi:hypothetical protein